MPYHLSSDHVCFDLLTKHFFGSIACYVAFCDSSFYFFFLVTCKPRHSPFSSIASFVYIYIHIYICFFHDRETTDSYTIAASPNFGALLQSPRLIYSSFTNHSKSDLDLDVKTPFLSAQEGKKQFQNGESGRISRRQSSLWEKASFHSQHHGELPVGSGCSFTQTVFNGEFFDSFTSAN